MRSMMLVALALSGCAGLIKTGSSTSTGTTAGLGDGGDDQTSASASSGGDMGRGPEAGPKPDHTFYLPVPNAPVDPWAGVDGDKPRTYDDGIDTEQWWGVRKEDAVCTAARDHCLPAVTWMAVDDGDTSHVKTAIPMAFTPEGPNTPHGGHMGLQGGNPFTAYRTVPATKKNLAPGAIVVAALYPKMHPEDSIDAFERWDMGVVERVDWDMGFVFFVNGKEPHFITASRVAVLSYRAGGKVTIIGGKSRAELAVDPADLILP